MQELQLKVRQSLLATLALITAHSTCRAALAAPLSSAHAHVQRGAAPVPEYPYPAQDKRTNSRR